MHNETGRVKENYYFIFENNKLLVENKNGQAIIPKSIDAGILNVNIQSGRHFGTFNGYDCYCLDKPSDYTPKENMGFQELRQLGNEFNVDLFQLSCRGLHILRWYENNNFCSKCGSGAEDKEDEMAKICPKCGYINYPRISPAIIVAVVNKDKLLLAHNARFAEGMYSILAGFVEPGETFEKCVVREVREEVGIEVKNIKYFGSQPWPFPDSVMIGFTAEYAGGDIKEDGVEIVHADWYKSNELPKVPTGSSVAGKLINWFKETYPQA